MIFQKLFRGLVTPATCEALVDFLVSKGQISYWALIMILNGRIIIKYSFFFL